MRDDGIRALVRAHLDRGWSVCVVGEAGIGRTTILRALAEAHPGPVLSGGGLQLLAGRDGFALEWAARAALPHDVAGLTDALAERIAGTGLLVVDDLQWADPLTLAAVAALVPTGRVLAAVRTGDPGTTAALEAVAGSQLVSVPHLDDAEAAAVARAHRADLDDHAIAAAVHDAGGNPSALQQRLEGGRLDEALVAALTGVVRSASASVDRTAVLLALAPRSLAPDVVPAVADAVAAGVAVVDATGVRLRHPAVGAAITAGLSPVELADHHRQLASLLTEPGERAEQLALAGDHQAAAGLAEAALATATDPGEAARWYEVLAQVVAEPAATGARLDAAAAHLAAGRVGRASRLVAGVDGLDREPDLDRLAARVRAEVAAARGDPAAIEHASVVLHDQRASADDRVRAWAATAAVQVWPLWQPEQAAFSAARARAEAEAPDVSAAARRTVELAAALAALALGDANWRAGLDERMPAGRALAAWGSLLDGKAADGGGLPPLLGAVLGFQADGDGDRAAARLRPLASVAGSPVAGLAAAYLAVALADSGRTAAAADVLAAATLGEPTPAASAVLLWAEAEVELAAGRLSRSSAAAVRAGAIVTSSFPTGPLAAVAGAWAAALAPDGNRIDGLAAATVASGPWTGPSTATIEQAALSASVGGDHGQAARLFGEAAAGWAGWNRRGELRCRWAGADAAGRAGDVAAAVASLLDIEAEAVEAGQRLLVARARRSLRAFGHRLARPRSPGRGPLSGREVEVLGLVAAGYTTAEAAHVLGVAASTVETQVETAMRKLGVRSRFQAAAMVGGLR
jgi:DNA-binding CsgD family transcriptional regulator